MSLRQQPNKKTVMLDEKEAAYGREDASNFFTFMIVMIIIPHIFLKLSYCIISSIMPSL